MKRARLLLVAMVLALVACTSGDDPSAGGSRVVSPSPPPTTTSPRARPTAPPFSAARAERTIRRLAALGPREAASATYARAADLVAAELDALGYVVRRQRVGLPAGEVDGRPVGRGTTQNVVAEPAGLDPTAPFLVVGAHLDTVPDSPGANDNASGVAVMLELARLAAVESPPLPVVFAAFGAEERRSRADYALGSRAYAAAIPPAARAGVRALVIDMVGAGDRVRVMGGASGLRREVLRAAAHLDVPVSTPDTRYYSDHLPFQALGMEAVWLWAGEHPSLHTPRDVPSVIERASLRRVGRLAWATIAALGA